MHTAILPFDTCSTYNHCIFIFFNQNIISCLNHFDHKIVDFQAKKKLPFCCSSKAFSYQ